MVVFSVLPTPRPDPDHHPFPPDRSTVLSDLLLEAIVQYQEGLKIMETHQLSVIGACRALRRLGQHSRLHQLILR